MEKLLNGIKILRDNVAVTYGPQGRNVIIRNDGDVHITKDGVTVANNTFSEDPEEQTGIDILRQAANKSLEDSGDGTTTTIMLAQEAIENTSLNNTININDFKLGAGQAVEEICKLLDDHSIKTFDLESLAKTSANGNIEIANLVSEAVKHCGSKGHIELKKSLYKDTIELKSGYTFKRGFLTPKFITDKTRLVAHAEAGELDCKILLVNGKLEKFHSTIPPLFQKSKKLLLVVAEDFSNEFISNCVTNIGKAMIIPVKLPEYGEQKLAFLEDLAFYTGAHIHNKESEVENESTLGNCDSFTVGKNETTVSSSSITPTELKDKLELIKSLRKNAESEFGKKKYDERISNLSGKNADIFVSGTTDADQKERSDLFDDAVKACQSALEDGVLPGAGMALMKLHKTWGKKIVDKVSPTPSAVLGAQMVVDLMPMPFKWLHSNIEINMAKINSHFDFVYNSKTNIYGPATEINVLDSCKTVKSSLINAVSVATTVLTSNKFINSR
jgi:chaperonin GroEL